MRQRGIQTQSCVLLVLLSLRADLRTPCIHHMLSSPSLTLGSISHRCKWSQPAGSAPDGGVLGRALIRPNDVGPLKTAGVTCANSITAGLQSQTFFCSHSLWRHDDNDDEHIEHGFPPSSLKLQILLCEAYYQLLSGEATSVD